MVRIIQIKIGTYNDLVESLGEHAKFVDVVYGSVSVRSLVIDRFIFIPELNGNKD